MEVGYSESYEDLTQDARLLLEESTGNIGTAILIKIQPLMPNEQNIKTAFLQAYHYDPVKGKGVPREGRESHAAQRLVFSWDNILKDQINSVSRKSAMPPLLHLDSLCDIINSYTERHISMKKHKENLAGP